MAKALSSLTRETLETVRFDIEENQYLLSSVFLQFNAKYAQIKNNTSYSSFYLSAFSI